MKITGINLIYVKVSRFYLLIGILGLMSCKRGITLDNVVTISHYSSGSAMTMVNGRVCLAGDDMRYLLVMDASFTLLDSIAFAGEGRDRIPKDLKPDIEAATAISQEGRELLLLLGSGSLAPYRNNGWLVDTRSKQVNKIDLDSFYARLRQQQMGELNIEGIAEMPGAFVLCNRGNNTHPENHLIFTEPGFWAMQATAGISVVKLGSDKENDHFSGVSGLAYSVQSDRLILTVSTEHTFNSYDDGTIGKSYLWLINNISDKKGMTVINPDQIIDLEAADKRFAGQKIEDVCILAETASEITLALVADNDAGNTVLFKVSLKK